MPLRHLEENQIGPLTHAINRKPHPIPIAYHLMLQAGLRIGEVIHLTWFDLIQNNVPVNTIHVDSAVAKHHHSRYIPVNPTLTNRIYDTHVKLRIHSSFSISSYVCTKTPGGKPVTSRTLQRHIRDTASKTINTQLTPHMLRHTFATRLLRVTDIRVVQELLGHKNIATTQIYTHPNHDDLRKAINDMHPFPE